MSLDDLFTNTETIIKGIVYTQIFTLPFSFSLSSGSLILSYGLISNNLKSISLSSNGFDEFNSQIFRAGLQFYLAGFITLVDVLMNFMDLSIVFQTVFLNSSNFDWLLRAPWTSPLTPLLRSSVYVVTQIYFLKKSYTSGSYPKLFYMIAMISILGCFFTNLFQSIWMFQNGSSEEGVEGTTSEIMLWINTFITTLLSLAISLALIKVHHLRSSKTSDLIQDPWNPQTLNLRTKLKSGFKRCLLNHLMIFSISLMSLMSLLFSRNSNFEISRISFQSFSFFQKLLVHVMSISYLYDLSSDELSTRQRLGRLNDHQDINMNHYIALDSSLVKNEVSELEADQEDQEEPLEGVEVQELIGIQDFMKNLIAYYQSLRIKT